MAAGARPHRVHRRPGGRRVRARVRRVQRRPRTASAWPTAPTRSSSRCARSASGPATRASCPANTFIATAEAVARAGRHAGAGRLRRRDTYLIDPGAVDGRGDRAHPGDHPRPPLRPGRPGGGLLAARRADRRLVVEDAAQSQGAAPARRRAPARSGTPRRPASTRARTSAPTATRAPCSPTPTSWPRGCGCSATTAAPASTTTRCSASTAGSTRCRRSCCRPSCARLDGWNDSAGGPRRALRRAARRPATRCVRPRTLAGNEHVWHLYVVRVPDRDRVLERLQAAGIGAGIHYPVPIHLTPAFAGLGYAEGVVPGRRAGRARAAQPADLPEITAGAAGAGGGTR